MGSKTILVQDVSTNTVPANATACSRTHTVLTLGYAGTAVGAWAATISVYQWIYGGRVPLKRLLATFTASHGSPTGALDLLHPADNMSAEVAFSANPSGDTVTVVVEG